MQAKLERLKRDAMSIRMILVGLTAAGLLGGAAVFLLRGAQGDILVESPRLVATDSLPGDAMVFMTLTNSGGSPDILIGAVSDFAGDCGFHGPTVGADESGAAFVVVPSGGSTSLSAETAHIELIGLSEKLEPGQLVPITLVFQNAGEVPVKARVEALVPRSELTRRAGLYEPKDGEPMPSIGLTAEPAENGRWRIRLALENFTIDRAAVDSAHMPGRGHAHLYIDNVKIGRLYETEILTDPLPPGEHQFAVTLNTNDHRAYAKDGAPVTATLTVAQ